VGIQVAAYSWNGSSWDWFHADFTDATGSYDIGGLGTETYRVRFRDSSGTYAREYYDDALDIDSATDIAVTTGTITSNINAQLVLAAHITGMVTNSAGTPLAGINVAAYRWNGSYWDWVNAELTSAGGSYDIGGLNTGTYHVRFRDPSGTYAREYYDNAPNISSGTNIAITAGTTTSDINAQLVFAGNISGTVTDTAGNPLVGIQVMAYRWNGSSWDWIHGDLTEGSGNYDIGDLNTGSYRVRFRDHSGIYATEYYDDALDIGSATDIAVTTGTITSNINAQLVLAAHITGTVTDTAGNPLMGITVATYRWNGSSWEWVNSDSTEITGSYEVGGLGTGTYHVRFRDSSGTYITEYYDDAPDISSGTDIVVMAGVTTSDINAQLAELVIIISDDVIIDFGSPYGLWMWMNNDSWTFLHPLSADSMVTGDLDGSGENDVIIDFGTSYGIWVRMNNTTWVQLDSDSPESMVTGDLDGSGQDDVVIDYGAGVGISVLMNNSAWVQLDSDSSESMVTGDIDGNGQDDVVIDYESGVGISVWMNNNTWVQLDPDSSESMVTGDMDGNGQDEVIIDFGSSDGIMVWMNNSAWVQLHFVSPESMVTGDIDGSGQEDVIIDFGALYGIWARMNNSAWDQLHSLSPESMVTGNIDGEQFVVHGSDTAKNEKDSSTLLPISEATTLP
jgi:5-hydroxyisourate hydrolase-like protein (transthyretin family)